jgi:hypothetical protein
MAIDWPYIDMSGLATVPQGDSLHLEEHFTLVPNNTELARVYRYMV